MALRCTPVNDQFEFKTVEVFQSQRIGQGSYGYVCRGKCDKLPCAAKFLHPMFFSSNDPGVNSVLSKFTEECKLLSSLSHPNIVQFIGVCNLDEQGPHPTPVLLTELMDESLMTFIARSRDSLVFIPFHVEVNISHDIALALSYLHSKNIIHRDLSSNNVLLVGTRAKVTDFGVAKLYDLQSQYTKYQTQCPGTPPFMSPESLLTPPKYTTKLDVFSWAVICIHLLSRHAPNPSPHLRRQVDSNGREVFVKVLEQERRAMDMSPIVQDHLLLPIALTCLSDDAESRPTADELCDLLEKVKMNEIYKDDTKVPAGEIGLRKELLHCEDEIKNLKAKVDELRLKNDELKLQQDPKHVGGDPTGYINQTSQNDATEITQSPQQEKDVLSSELSSSVGYFSGPFKWFTIVDESPCIFTRGSITRLEDTIYLSRIHSCVIHTFNVCTNTWSILSELCPVKEFSLVAYKGKLMAVGGVSPDYECCSSKVYTYIGGWVEKYIKNMFYPRCQAAVVSSELYLLVAGGYNKSILDSVEIYDHTKSQWFVTYSLPVPLQSSVAVIHKSDIFIVGGISKHGYSRLLYTAPLQALYDWSSRFTTPISVRPVWKHVQCPVASPAPVIHNEQLYLVGGIMAVEDSYPEKSSHIFKYTEHDCTFSISDTPRVRGCCLAISLSDTSGIFVVGGCGNKTVDIGKL